MICPGKLRPGLEPHHPESHCDATIASTEARMTLSDAQIARWNPKGLGVVAALNAYILGPSLGWATCLLTLRGICRL
jgi:hypothetical protein